MFDLVPMGIDRRVVQAIVSAEVDDSAAEVEQFADDGRAGAVGEAPENAVGPAGEVGGAEIFQPQRDPRTQGGMDIPHVRAIFLPGAQRGDIGFGVSEQEFQQFPRGVTGRSKDCHTDHKRGLLSRGAGWGWVGVRVYKRDPRAAMGRGGVGLYGRVLYSEADTSATARFGRLADQSTTDGGCRGRGSRRTRLARTAGRRSGKCSEYNGFSGLEGRKSAMAGADSLLQMRRDTAIKDV